MRIAHSQSKGGGRTDPMMFPKAEWGWEAHQLSEETEPGPVIVNLHVYSDFTDIPASHSKRHMLSRCV